MKKLLLLSAFLTLSCSLKIYSQKINSDILKKEMIKLLNEDKESMDDYLNNASIWGQKYFKFIESRYLRQKYASELNLDLKMGLDKVFEEKMLSISNWIELFNRASSSGLMTNIGVEVTTNNIPKEILSEFYKDWYINQLMSLEIFNELFLIFDSCEFQYNPESSENIFVFFTDNCLNNYNSKMSEFSQIVNDDIVLRTKFKSDFKLSKWFKDL